MLHLCLIPPVCHPPSFLRLWVAVLVVHPTNQAVVALTFSNYVLQPIFPTCLPPEGALRLLAAVCLRKIHGASDVGLGNRRKRKVQFEELFQTESSKRDYQI